MHKLWTLFWIVSFISGERPYSCNECQHHFTNWPNYNKHMKRRHGINTSVTCRTRQDIPPTGMPHRNPPGTVLAPPQPVVISENFVDLPPTFYPVLNLYNIPEELLQQRMWSLWLRYIKLFLLVVLFYLLILLYQNVNSQTILKITQVGLRY